MSRRPHTSRSHFPINKLALIFGLVMVSFLAIHSVALAQAESAKEGFVPQRVVPPSNAPYVLSDGSIYVAGNDLLIPYFEKLNELFAKTHPGFRFKMDLYTSGLAVGGLLAGKSAFGPMARDP